MLIMSNQLYSYIFNDNHSNIYWLKYSTPKSLNEKHISNISTLQHNFPIASGAYHPQVIKRSSRNLWRDPITP